MLTTLVAPLLSRKARDIISDGVLIPVIKLSSITISTSTSINTSLRSIL